MVYGKPAPGATKENLDLDPLWTPPPYVEPKAEVHVFKNFPYFKYCIRF